jgi:hypothetical protein
MGAKGKIKLAGLVVLGMALASRTANTMTGPGVRADGLRWQAIARVYSDLERARAANSPSPQGLRADGLRWQGIARVYSDLERARAANSPSPQGLRADGLRWQGIAGAYQRATESLPSSRGSAGFSWSDAGIGGAVIFGLILLAAATARFMHQRQVLQPLGPKRDMR